ncbi:cell division initiation protein [Streptomyces sp. NPDC004749]
MDVQKKLDEIVDTVGSARSMPMSASCVVNRAELLAMLEEVREALPGSLAQAQELIGGREQMAEQARQEAGRILEAARAERATLLAGTAIARQSQEEADRILAEARREAEEIRAEADDYVDSKLANFEVVLTKTIGSVDRGREKLLGRSPGTGGEDDDAPEYSSDPATLIGRADEYVDAKLGAFEAVLSKTLEAVGRGRQKLHGRIASDELGAHMAAQDAAGPQGRTSDADYLAGLAGTPGDAAADLGAGARAPGVPAPVPAPSQPPAAPVVPEAPPAVPGPYMDPAYAQPAAGYQDPGQGYPGVAQGTGYQDPGYAEPGYAAYQQQDGAYGGYQQQPYGYEQQGYGPDYGWQQPAGQSEQPALPAGTGRPEQSALDETSFFDTSMIDMDQLRRYEQGR